ncbi:hypothetical protein HZS_897 [Henneguya salminicola]|nr:hypothetical protein HZS_897 [Henneguya salminicola]
MADGRKLPPLIIFKGKRIPIDLKNIRGAHVFFTANEWMLPETTEMWIKNIWRTFSFQRRLLVWDAFRCYLTPGIKKTLKSTNTLMACIPGRCTKLLQPADVSVAEAARESLSINNINYDLNNSHDELETDEEYEIE